MTSLLMRIFLKDTDISTSRGRELCGRLAGIVGIICNMILCAFKIGAGMLTSSIAIMADGVNNLADAGSSVITLIGFRLSGKAADDDHPFGHGRMEYVTALIISIIILIIGFNLGKSSVEKIISPEAAEFSIVSLIILGVSILAKLWLAMFNRKLGKSIGSTALEATSQDSRNDAIATTAVLVASVISYFTNVDLDGYMGALVAIFILWSGISLIKETIGPLLGQAPDPEIVSNLREKILSYDGILGVHDFMVHCYGPGIYFASAHIEMDANSSMLACHDTLDLIENEVKQKMDIHLVLHLDPMVTDDAETNSYRLKVSAILELFDSAISMHDFRVITGEKAKNLVFDILVPRGYHLRDHEIKEILSSRIKEAIPEQIGIVITVDHSFIIE